MPWNSLVAALGHDLDVAASRTAVLGLIVRGQNLELSDVVQGQRDVLRAVRSGVDIGRAVDRQVVLIGARAVDVECCRNRPGPPSAR